MAAAPTPSMVVRTFAAGRVNTGLMTSQLATDIRVYLTRAGVVRMIVFTPKGGPGGPPSEVCYQIGDPDPWDPNPQVRILGFVLEVSDDHLVRVTAVRSDTAAVCDVDAKTLRASACGSDGDIGPALAAINESRNPTLPALAQLASAPVLRRPLANLFGD